MTEEHAIAIARVSQMKQRPEDQRPELVAYAERKGYVLDEVVPVHGRSAFHGRHVKQVLDAVEKHVRRGGATVVIFRHVDRSSREGVFKGFDLLNKIMAAGARIEFSEQEFLNVQPGWIGPLFELAKEESKIKQDRKNQGNARKRAEGELVGNVPWGYDPVTVKRGALDVRIGIKPNALGRKWVPRIFNEAVAGKSVESIAAMLGAEGVPSPQKNDAWGRTTIRRIIASTTYCGAMKGNPNLKFEALVSVELHKRANLAVASRTRQGRGTVVREPAFLKPVCGACYGEKRKGAPSGVSPMYRSVKPLNGKEYAYYYCAGHGTNRKACGADLIDLAALDAAVDSIMTADTDPYLVLSYSAGDDNDELRAVINEKIRVAQEASDYLLVAQLAQEAMQIGPSIRKASVGLVESGQTNGEHWQALSMAEKREELKRWVVIAYPDGKVRLFFPRGDRDRSVVGDMIEAERV